MEKLNNARVMAMKITPAEPKWWYMAVCNRSIPDSPTVISSGARSMIMKVERDELVEELLTEYIKNRSWEY